MTVNIDLTGVVLETERLILRTWREDDLNDFYEYASVEGVGEMAGWPHHACLENTRAILDCFIAEKNVFAIQLKESDKVIGSLGFHKSWTEGKKKYAHLKAVEIGYVLSEDYWGKGLMTEAVKRAIKYLFEETSSEAVTVAHFIGNYRSEGVIRKSGFKFAEESEYYSIQMKRSFCSRNYILIKPAKYESPKTGESEAV